MNGKADLIFRLADDLDVDQRRILWSVARVSHVGKRFGHEREGLPRQSQNRDGTIAILNVSRLRIKHESTSVHIDHRLSLAAFDLFTRIISTRTTALGGFDTLAIQHSSTWRGLAAGPLAIHHDEAVIDPREDTSVTPAAEIPENRALGRQVFRDETPGNAAPQNVKMALMISRSGQAGLRPLGAGCGRRGAITAHSASVRSVSYRG